MELAVIILSYNHPDITARTLRSVEKFKFANTYLIHNGSEQKHTNKLKIEFPSVKHLHLDKNKGYSGGANFGLKEVFKNHEWCLFLTNDCELESVGKIPTAPCVVAPKIMIRSTSKIHSLGGLFDPKRGFLRHCLSKEEFQNSFLRKYIPGTAFLIHKDIFLKSDGFDESLFTYWEDVEWSQRVQKLDYELQLDDQWIIKHGVGKTCHKNSLYTLYYFQRNRKRISFQFAPKHHRPLLLLNLTKDWGRIAFKLLKSKRHSDIRVLRNAIWDK